MNIYNFTINFTILAMRICKKKLIVYYLTIIMKCLKSLNNVTEILNQVNTDWENFVEEINKEYKQNIKLERNILLKKIAEDHNMDYEALLEQYVYKNKRTPVILEIARVKGKECYYQNLKDSDVYDEDSNVIGTFNGKKVVLNA